MSLSARQKKTVLRTLRISKELDDILEKDAKAHRTSVNGLVSSIMVKYAEWDRYAERFGQVSLALPLFRALLDLADENALAALAEHHGVEGTKEIISFWFKKINLESLLRLLSIQSEYANLIEVEIENEGRDYTISIRHEYGKKWSTYVEHCLDTAIRTYLKVIPQLETTENTVTLRFQAP